MRFVGDGYARLPAIRNDEVTLSTFAAFNSRGALHPEFANDGVTAVAFGDVVTNGRR